MYISSAEIDGDKIKLKYSDDSLDSCNDKVSLTSEQFPRPELYEAWNAMKKHVLELVKPLQGFENVSFFKVELFNYHSWVFRGSVNQEDLSSWGQRGLQPGNHPLTKRAATLHGEGDASPRGPDRTAEQMASF